MMTSNRLTIKDLRSGDAPLTFTTPHIYTPQSLQSTHTTLTTPLFCKTLVTTTPFSNDSSLRINNHTRSSADKVEPPAPTIRRSSPNTTAYQPSGISQNWSLVSLPLRDSSPLTPPRLLSHTHLTVYT